jgi:beta-xylosidase
MFAIVFEKYRDPVVWETNDGWPGTIHMRLPQGSCIYYPKEASQWKWLMSNHNREIKSIEDHLVPPEYRAFILLLN